MDAALRLANLDEMPVDTDILVDGNVTKVLVGIDMDTAELLLAKELGCDCVVSHHPKNSNPDYAEIMNRHIDKMVESGVPINKAQRALRDSKDKVAKSRHVGNTERFASAAKLLGMPYMCVHSPADLITEEVLQKLVDKKLNGNPRATIKDVLEALNTVPEFEKATIKTAVRVGDEKSYAGKTVVCMSGGTNGGAAVLKAYFDAGVGTVIQMHATEDDIKAAKEQNIGNLVVTPHMASDSVGMNVILDEWRKMGVEVVVMSGMVR